MRQEFLGFYKKLQKSRKRLLLRSFLFALFLIGVNIFAWFTYVSKAGLQLEGNISSWDVDSILVLNKDIVEVIEND